MPFQLIRSINLHAVTHQFDSRTEQRCPAQGPAGMVAITFVAGYQRSTAESIYAGIRVRAGISCIPFSATGVDRLAFCNANCCVPFCPVVSAGDLFHIVVAMVGVCTGRMPIFYSYDQLLQPLHTFFTGCSILLWCAGSLAMSIVFRFCCRLLLLFRSVQEYRSPCGRLAMNV